MTRSRQHVSRLCLFGIAFCSWASYSTAAQRVHVVIGANAPKIEQYAADELAAMLPRLFADVEGVVATKIPNRAAYIIMIGSPATNPEIKRAIGTGWPVLSDQGVVLKSHESSRGQQLIIGGGSPTATLWAVYEFGHHLGARYLLRGDMYPNTPKSLSLADFDHTSEPQLRTRTWRTINDFAVGPESWSIEEHRRVLKQLAKLKFNRLLLQVYPWQPFVDYEFAGVKKQTAMLWYGEQYPVNGETVGKKVFRGQTRFENPHFSGCTTPTEMSVAGKSYVQGIIATAKELGMSVGIGISPLEFPREFQRVLPESRVGRGLNSLTIIPTAEQGPRDATLRKLVATKIRAYIKTYPDLDSIYLTIPEFPEWGQHAHAAWNILKPGLAKDAPSLEELLQTASDRSLIASGDRGIQSVKGNIVALAFLKELLKDESLLESPNGHAVNLVITGIDPALYSLLPFVIPENAGTLHFVDYTARRVLANREMLEVVPTKKVESQLILTLADDNVGILPQSATASLEQLVSHLKTNNWSGFSTRYWIPAELDPDIYHLSRASWDVHLTAEAAHKELWTTATGNESASNRLWMARQHLEHATNLIDKNDLGFAFPVKGMLMKHYIASPIPQWWEEANESYTQYMIELYRANGAIAGDAKPILFYYAKRGEYVLEYLAAVKAVREAALAKKAGDTEMAIEQLEVALEQMYNCINTLSDVARDQSDRGLIAVLNAYAYRPLLAEYEKLADSEE
ncbi:MAG: hypothetical protein VB878_16425 [Pirellulaceae bacterium]